MPRPNQITPEVQKQLDALYSDPVAHGMTPQEPKKQLDALYSDPVAHGMTPQEPKKKHSSFVQISYNAKQKLASLFKKAFRRK